jgi:hypothetical protein
LSTSEASPNDTGIVIVIIIIVIIGEAKLTFHNGGIIAQFPLDFINFENQIVFQRLKCNGKSCIFMSIFITFP